jgi:hypothetical protein
LNARNNTGLVGSAAASSIREAFRLAPARDDEVISRAAEGFGQTHPKSETDWPRRHRAKIYQ